MRYANEMASQVTNCQTPLDSVPNLSNTHILPPTRTRAASIQVQTPSLHQPKHKLSQSTWSTESQYSTPSFPAVKHIALGHVPLPSIAQCSHRHHTANSYSSAELSPTVSMFGKTCIQASSISSQSKVTKTSANLGASSSKYCVSLFPGFLQCSVP